MGDLHYHLLTLLTVEDTLLLRKIAKEMENIHFMVEPDIEGAPELLKRLMLQLLVAATDATRGTH